MKIFVILVVISAKTSAQPAHEVPFASSENVLELAVETTPGTALSNAVLRVLQAPEWLRVRSREQSLGRVSHGQGVIARLPFSIDKSAPINRPESFEVAIIDDSGQRWTREIGISVAPPAEFALLQNYPNPFNPTTTVGYQLAAESRVRISVYDLLGREVVALADRTGSAGFHEVIMDASTLSSGMYILKLVATPPDGRQIVRQRAITVLK
jgi:hypothetical protein